MTDSGKTTIFDGIMYALYNKMGGGDRETKMMRSEYAKDKQKTFVEFTFEYTHGENKGVYVSKKNEPILEKAVLHLMLSLLCLMEKSLMERIRRQMKKSRA